MSWNIRRFSRKRRLEKYSSQRILYAFIVISVFWIAVCFYFFLFSFQDLSLQGAFPIRNFSLPSNRYKETSPNKSEGIEKNINSGNNDKIRQRLKEYRNQQKQQTKNDEVKKNWKKKNEDRIDYRTVKIETPPPKQHHEGKIGDILSNLTATNPVYIGREKLVRMLLEMWIDVTQIDDSIWEKVPLWKDIIKIHGNSPVIYGLDSCPTFRESVPEFDRRFGIAGMFSTGTNLLAILMQHNCVNEARVEKLGKRKRNHGMEWQVPWGKHTPAWYRGVGHVKTFIGKIDPNDMMVGVMVRHPYDWMMSMCRHGYTAKWNHTSRNCPNLYDGNEVIAKFGPGPSHHQSLAHMWNDWYGVYYNATFPRLLIRFEDVIFYPKETTRLVCHCVGGELRTPKERDGLFHYVIDSAKVGVGHGPGKKRNGLIDSWIKYGKPLKIGMKKSDLKFAANVLDQNIMKSLRWNLPLIPS